LEEILQSGLLDEDKWSNELVTEQIITNLLFGKQYFVNVCVRDPDNNISIYTPAPFTTIGRISFQCWHIHRCHGFIQQYSTPGY
jgi:hypothetical protein